MAFVGKPNIKPRLGVPTYGRLHASRVAAALPQSTTDILFRVRGGKIRVLGLIGTVTTAIAAVDPVAKITSKALDNGSAVVGTAVDIATTVALTSLELGGLIVAKCDGTALTKANAGGGAAINGNAVVSQGEIYLTTGASVAGAVRWDLYYEQLDEGAFASPNPVQVAI